MKILVTGFDPFGGDKVNPAYEAVKLLPTQISGAEIIKLEVPTVFGKSAEKMREAIIKEKPDAVLCIGQAGGRSAITVEKVGINLNEARIADNEGNQPLNAAIRADGDTAYFSNLPVKAMVAAVKEKGIPAAVSYTAGTFVCNELLYNLLYLIDKEFPTLKGGFIHVPFDTAQVVDRPLGTASMPVETISEGIGYAIAAIVANKEDLNILAGEIQ